MAKTHKIDVTEYALWAIGEALGLNEQHDAHVVARNAGIGWAEWSAAAAQGLWA